MRWREYEIQKDKANTDYNNTFFRYQLDGTVGRMVALHAANLGLNPSTSYIAPSITRSDALMQS